MPGMPRNQIGSDHGPSGRSAVTTKLPPCGPTCVQITWNLPRWWRIVGANIPPETLTRPSAGACDGRWITLPTWTQWTRSRL